MTELNNIYTYIHTHTHKTYSSLCYTVGLCHLSILYIVLSVCYVFSDIFSFHSIACHSVRNTL